MKEGELIPLRREVQEIQDRHPHLSPDNAFVLWFLWGFIVDDEATALAAILGGSRDKGVDALHVDLSCLNWKWGVLSGILTANTPFPIEAGQPGQQADSGRTGRGGAICCERRHAGAECMDLPQAVEQGLAELKEALAGRYGERLKGVYLYGSYARGDFTADSDVDLLVALDGEVRPTREMDGLSATVADICLRHDLLISVYPVPAGWLAERKSPLFENIRREGVRL